MSAQMLLYSVGGMGVTVAVGGTGVGVIVAGLGVLLGTGVAVAGRNVDVGAGGEGKGVGGLPQLVSANVNTRIAIISLKEIQ